MNNKVIAAVVAVVVIAAGAYYFTRGQDNNSVNSDGDTRQSEPAETTVENSSIKGLLADGRAQMCTYSSADEHASSTGTVYVADGKVRADINSDFADNTHQVTHMINDGTTAYVWTDEQATGIKMPVMETTADSAARSGIDQDKNYEFHCERWNADSSRFELPSGITFTEMPTLPDAGASMPTGTVEGASTGFDSKDLQLAACSNLPEPAKSSCLSAIQ